MAYNITDLPREKNGCYYYWLIYIDLDLMKKLKLRGSSSQMEEEMERTSMGTFVVIKWTNESIDFRCMEYYCLATVCFRKLQSFFKFLDKCLDYVNQILSWNVNFILGNKWNKKKIFPPVPWKSFVKFWISVPFLWLGTVKCLDPSFSATIFVPTSYSHPCYPSSHWYYACNFSMGPWTGQRSFTIQCFIGYTLLLSLWPFRFGCSQITCSFVRHPCSIPEQNLPPNLKYPNPWGTSVSHGGQHFFYHRNHSWSLMGGGFSLTQ